ncbi:flagellar FliJ family protein [candidate division WOR-3 bacterium]|nr:flagellar FliJ family protein [candidate division WOR-3 bacterium]
MKIEEKRKRELGKAKYALFDAELKVSDLKNLQKEEIEEMSSSVFDFLYLRVLYDNYLFRIRNELSLAKNDVHKKTTTVDKKREELIEATKPRKVMEKLKEKRLNLHNRARARWEQASYDESAKHRFLNKND